MLNSKSLNNVVNNERGFGLLESIIAAVILGLVSLAVVYLVTGADGQSAVKRKDYNESCRNVADGVLELVKEKGNALASIKFSDLTQKPNPSGTGTIIECSTGLDAAGVPCDQRGSEYSKLPNYKSLRLKNKKANQDKFYGDTTVLPTSTTLQPWNLNVERLSVGYMNYLNTVVNNYPGVCTPPSAVTATGGASGDILSNTIAAEAFEYFKTGDTNNTAFMGQFGSGNSSSSKFQVRVFVELFDVNTGAPVPTTIPCATLSVYPMLPAPGAPNGFRDKTTQQVIQPYPDITNNKYSNVGFKVTAKIRYEAPESGFSECSSSQKFQYDIPVDNAARPFTIRAMTAATPTKKELYVNSQNDYKFSATVTTRRDDSILMCRDRSRARNRMLQAGTTTPQRLVTLAPLFNRFEDVPTTPTVLPPTEPPIPAVSQKYPFTNNGTFNYFVQCAQNSCIELPPFRGLGNYLSYNAVQVHDETTVNTATVPLPREKIDKPLTASGSMYEKDVTQDATWIPCIDFINRFNDPIVEAPGTPPLTRLRSCRYQPQSSPTLMGSASIISLVNGEFTFNFTGIREGCDIKIDIAELSSDYRILPDDNTPASPTKVLTISQTTPDLLRGDMCWNGSSAIMPYLGDTISAYTYFFAGYNAAGVKNNCAPATYVPPIP